jgi:PleD family two-component response regulator
LELAQETAARICKGIEITPFMVEGNEIHVTMSFGVSNMKTTFAEGYRNADLALYEAKKSGKNQIRVYPD